MADFLETIMFIDDDDASNFYHTQVIEECGCAARLEVFRDPLDALHFISRINERDKETDFLPDLIFLDLNMPKMSGWEFIPQFNKLSSVKHFHIPLVILSSSANQKDIQQAMATAGVLAYVVKPLSEDSLKRILSSL